MLLHLGWGAPLLLAFASLTIGSFLNVVIHRLPIMLERRWREDARGILDMRAEETAPFNLMHPRSRCPRCGSVIPMRRNVPLLSWLLLRGRCGDCGGRISFRYPLVEALTAILSLVVINTLGWQWAALAALLFTWSLIALAMIDFETGLLPDQITLPLLWGGLLASAALPELTPVTPVAAIVGAATGYLTLWALYHGFKAATGKEGMGHGDFKLFAALGAWLGVAALPAVALLASVTGLAYALALLGLKAMRRQEAIPFGPFLAASGWVTLLFGDTLVAMYWAEGAFVNA